MTLPPHVDVHLTAEELARVLKSDALAGLGAKPRELPPKWFYDERGCALFEEITRLPEYYPTRRESEILAREASEIARLTGADTLVELGSGTSEKTRLLLDAMAITGQLARIAVFDVSETTIRTAAAALAVEYPGVEVHGVVGDFHHHLHHLPTGGRRLLVFLGGTIGNFGPTERKWFLGELASGMRLGDGLLLGTDLVKDVGRLEAAYDDASGVTAAFNRNVLVVLNRELDADFDVGQFVHEATYDPDNERMDIGLRTRTSQSVNLAAIELTLELEPGELIRTEISTKFRRPLVEEELGAAGLKVARWWTDDAEDYAVTLSFSAGQPG